MISREELGQVLRDWRAGDKDPLTVWQWAEQAREVTRESGGAADELVRDVVDCLAVLPFDMIVVEDAEVMLDALANPLDETDLSINMLWNHLDGIPTDGRRHDLVDHPFYGQFCDGME